MTFFYIITVMAIVLFLFLAKDIDFSSRKIFSISLTLLFAGAIGNFIDRVAFQSVTDFIDVYIFGWDFPIFNVADMCLTTGVFAFAVDLFVFEPKRNKPQ